MSTIKKFMYINRTAPYGSIYALEGLEVALIGAAFDQDVSMAFVDDGVFQLKKGQDTSESDMKNFSPAYRALGDYDITRLYVEKESLQARGLSLDDLMPLTYEDEDDDYEEKPSIRLVDSSELKKIIAEQDVLLNY
jgi:tRNA 2-thiouridine synthesizing protein C